MAKKSGGKKGADAASFDEYLERKKRLRKLHQRLKETKENQEIYHQIMGSTRDEEATEVSEEE